MSISDYNTNPNLNTSVNGVNIAEGCAPANINNAIRQVMADLAAEPVATRPLESFGSITGITLATDMATWNAALAWATANQGTIIAPPDKSSVIATLHWPSFARAIGHGHTFRLSGAGGIVQTAGTQCYGAWIEGFTFIPHTGGDTGRQAMKFTCLQNSYIGHITGIGLSTGLPFSIESATVSSFDVTTDPWSNSNSTFNHFEDWVFDSSAGAIYLAGKYGTVTSSGIPSSSPDPAAVITKNTYIGLKFWNVSNGPGSAIFHIVKCCDSEHFYDMDARSTGNITFLKYGNGDADTFFGNNYVNSHRFEVTAACGGGTTTATMAYGVSWTFGNHIDLEHDIDFITPVVTVTAKSTHASVTLFGMRPEGKWFDTSVGNTGTFDGGNMHYLRVASGSQTDPSLSYDAETGLGFHRESAGRQALAHGGARTYYWDAAQFAMPDGTAALPSGTFTGFATTGYYRTGTSFGIASSGVARAVFADAFTNILKTLYVNSAAVVATTGKVYNRQPAPTPKAAAATLTAAEVEIGILTYTGAAANITVPTGADLDAGFPLLATDKHVDLSIINTGSGTVTLVANTNVTAGGTGGSVAVAAGTSGLFRFRRTGAATYTVYRVA